MGTAINRINNIIFKHYLMPNLSLIYVLIVDAHAYAETPFWEVCTPKQMTCAEGQHLTKDYYPARYPDLHFPGVDVVYYCEEDEYEIIIRDPVDSNVIGRSSDCRDVVSAEYKDEKKFGDWEVYWESGSIRQKFSYDERGELLSKSIYDPDGNQLSDEFLTYPSSKVNSTRDLIFGPTVHRNNSGIIFRRDLVEVCDEVGPEFVYKLYMDFKELGPTPAFIDHTPQSMTLVSTPETNASGSNASFYSYYLDLTNCGSLGGQYTCGLKVSSWHNTAPIIGGVMQFGAARQSDDSVSSAMVENTLLEIEQGGLSCQMRYIPDLERNLESWIR